MDIQNIYHYFEQDKSVKTQTHSITRDDIKRNNRIRIYNALRETGKLSCAQIARHLSLSLPTVGKNISELEEKQLVRVSEVKGNTGGRNSKVYEAVADYRVAVGVNITKHHISAVVVDLLGHVISQVRYRVAFSRSDDYYRRLGDAVSTVIRDADISEDKILGVSLVIPALITKDRQRTYYNGVLNIDPVVNCHEFARYIPYTACFCHDAKSAAFAESWFTPSESDFFYLMLSDTICGAPFVADQPYSGHNNRSGEIGHVRLVKNGRLCYCGKRGCMDPYCSTRVLTSITDGDLAGFFNLLESKDPKAESIWSEYLEDLSVAVSNIRMLYDSNIVIGGYLGQYMDQYLDQLNSLCIPNDPYCDSIDYLSVCKYKNEASATGGALYYIVSFIQSV